MELYLRRSRVQRPIPSGGGRVCPADNLLGTRYLFSINIAEKSSFNPTSFHHVLTELRTKLTFVIFVSLRPSNTKTDSSGHSLSINQGCENDGTTSNSSRTCLICTTGPSISLQHRSRKIDYEHITHVVYHYAHLPIYMRRTNQERRNAANHSLINLQYGRAISRRRRELHT